MYQYYVKDFAKNKVIPFETKEDLSLWWIRNNSSRNGVHYDNLNMNGNDTYVVRWFNWNYETCRIERHLRRYMIIETATNRIIDIRNWNIEKMELPKPQHHWWGQSGAKNHSHRKGSAPMLHSTIRNELTILDFDDDEYGNIIKQLKAKPSHFAKTNAWDYAELAHCHDWTSSKCWKDQCKSPKQYWKHKKGFGKLPKSEDDVEDIYDDFDSSFEGNNDVA